MKASYLASALVKLLENNSQSKAVIKFLNFMEKKGLLHLLPSIIFFLQKEMEKEKKKNTITIIASHELSKDIISSIKKITKADKDAMENFEIDKNIIGGFVAEFNNVIFDGSVRNQLIKMENLFKN